MDGDLIKSAREDQIDMMMMQTHMEKLPEFSTFLDVGELPPPLDFHPPNPVMDSLPLTSPPLINQPLIQDPVFATFDRGDQGKLGGATAPGHKRNSVAAMREMIFRIAAMQPIHIDPESVKPPKRRNVKISKDPQSVAARHRRERISERIRILQRLVPGGTKMDTASMLDEAIHYVKFLKTQVQSLERAAANRNGGLGFNMTISSGNYSSMGKGYHQPQIFSPTQLLS